MKSKFKFIIILLLFLTTGCSVNYDLKINKDLSVEESFVALEAREELKNDNYNSLDEVIKEAKKMTTVDTTKYNILKQKSDGLFGAKVTRKYKTIDMYVKQLNDYNWFLNKSTYTLSSDIATLKFKKEYQVNQDFVNLIYKIDAKVNIYVPFEVVDHNADSVDKDKNIYTWELNNYTDTSEEINLSFNTKKRKVTVDYKKILLVSSVFAIALLGILVFIKVNINRNNDI